MATIQRITPHLWFDMQAEEAVKFYLSVFRNSSLGKKSHYGKEGYDVHKMPEGLLLTQEFFLDGQRFIALNGGKVFTFNESISMVVTCDTQQEIDYYWEKLTEGGDEKAQICGWLKDKFGVSWQVVPAVIQDWLVDSPSAATERMMKVFMKMKKLIIDDLNKAYYANEE